jgi:hypothetical protein
MSDRKRKLSRRVLALPLHKRAELALADAVESTIAERLRNGLPVYVWSDGKVVDLAKSKVSRPKSSPRRK